MKEIQVQDIMTRNPITVKPDTDLLKCAKEMIKKRVRSLLLVENKKLKGIISQRDIIWATVKKSENHLSKIKAKDISPRKIITIKPTASIEEALKKIKKSKIEKLPVIKDKELVGIITVRDILNFNPEIYSELNEVRQIREESEKLKRIQKVKDRKFMHEGFCEECGNQDILYKIDGRVICESCKNSM